MEIEFYTKIQLLIVAFEVQFEVVNMMRERSKGASFENQLSEIVLLCCWTALRNTLTNSKEGREKAIHQSKI